MTKMSLELQVGFEPTPCRLQVGCSTTEATAAYAGLSRLPGKQVKYVLFYIGEKRNQCVCGASSRFPARRFVHLLDTTSIADAFSKIAQFFSNFALCLGNAVQ